MAMDPEQAAEMQRTMVALAQTVEGPQAQMQWMTQQQQAQQAQQQRVSADGSEGRTNLGHIDLRIIKGTPIFRWDNEGLARLGNCGEIVFWLGGPTLGSTIAGCGIFDKWNGELSAVE